MTATPAWPLNSLPRLFIDEHLTLHQRLTLDGPAFHYLCRVMRKGAGDHIKCFDDRTGEYLAQIESAYKRKCTIIITQKLKQREQVPDLWLCAAPIKRDRWYMMAEKACELGVAAIVPVQTQRTIIDKIKDDKLRNYIIEAAEQCERTALPQIKPLQKLTNFLSDLPSNRTLYFCDERASDSGKSFTKAIANNDGPAAILIGPEGGFTDAENTAIRGHSGAVAISLGPRILRAETAAIASISAWMNQTGHW